MAIITDYAFGKMTIDGSLYTSDLVILPGGDIRPEWYRQSGHFLTRKDLAEVICHCPGLIIAGTGAYGRMVPASDLEANLMEMGIRLLAMATEKAVERYNAEARNHTPGLCGCFHLTC